MKKIIFFFVLLFLLFPLISAVEFDVKANFSQGETLMAKVSGNFLEPVLKENIFFYRGHVKIPVEYDIAKIDEDYYIYALLGDKSPDNYSVAVEGVSYKEGTETVEKNIIRNFTITNETADFSVNPGFIITEDNFSIEIQNLKDYSIIIKIDENKTETEGGFFSFFFQSTDSENESVIVKSGEIKNINFELGNETSFRKILLSTENLEYKIPVYAFVSQIQEEENEEEQNASEEEQEQGEETNQTKEEKITKATTKTCAEAGGTICKSDEKCSEAPVQAKDAICCLKTCGKIEKKITGKLIGWGLLVVLFIIILWFVKKTSKAKKKTVLLDLSKGKIVKS